MSPEAERLLALWSAQVRDYAVLLLDPDGRVVGSAGGLEEQLGFAAGELIGDSLARIFTAEDRALGLDRHELVVAATIGRGEDDRWHLRQDGTRVWISGVITALRDADGRLVGYAKAMRDRTDLRAQIETLERRIVALEHGDEQKNVFLATLAHELRNPLAPLANAAHLIRLAGGDDRMRYPLQVIDRQLALLKRLVDDMMDVTRIETGKLELQFAPLELQAVVRQAVELCRPQAAGKPVALEAVLPEVPIGIEADASRIEQIVVNLVHNAIKYTPAGGCIWVKLTVEVGTAVLRVQDTGIGVAPEMLPRIFELFTQETEARPQADGGLGIGLSLVKRLVEAHQGIVEVRSEGRDRGAEFTVRLPLRQTR